MPGPAALTESDLRPCSKATARPRNARWRPASTWSMSMPRMAICCTRSSRPSPTNVTTVMAAAWRTGCAFRWRWWRPCAPNGRLISRYSCGFRRSVVSMSAGRSRIRSEFAKALAARGVDVVDCSSGGMKLPRDKAWWRATPASGAVRRQDPRRGARRDHGGRPDHRASSRLKRSCKRRRRYDRARARDAGQSGTSPRRRRSRSKAPPAGISGRISFATGWNARQDAQARRADVSS